jgi:hypothetical protein
MTNLPANTFRFFRGDLLLGTLVQTAALNNGGWQGGAFEPAAGFERVRPLFDNELRLLNTGRRQEWQEIWEEIQRPGLRLEPVSGGEPLTGLLIHIENESAWWK